MATLFSSDEVDLEDDLFTFGDFEFIKDLELDYKLDVVCQHGRFKQRDLEKMVGKRAVFFTILRDPLEQFISMWNFYRYRFKDNSTTMKDWLDEKKG